MTEEWVIIAQGEFAIQRMNAQREAGQNYESKLAIQTVLKEFEKTSSVQLDTQ